jgi:hypothetical protein
MDMSDRPSRPYTTGFLSYPSSMTTLGVYTHARKSDRAHNQSSKPTVKTTMVLLIQYKNTTSIHNNEIIYNYKTTTTQLQNNYNTTTKLLQHDYKTTTKQL